MIAAELDLRALLGLLRRRYRLVVTTVVLILAAASVGMLALRPVYTASALVMVDPTPKDLLDPDPQRTSLGADGTRVDSEVELVKAPTTLMSVVQSLDLADDPEFGVRLGLNDMVLAFFRIAQPPPATGGDARQSVMERLAQAVSVERKGSTYLISIDARSHDPQRAAAIANALADAYIRQQLDSKVTSTLASRSVVEGHIAEASSAVSDSERAFDTFIEGNIDRISADTGRTDLADLRQRLASADAAHADAATLSGEVGDSLGRRDWQAVAGELKSAAIAGLAADRDALQVSLAGATDGSQRATDLKAEIARVDARLTDATRTELATLTDRASAAQAEANDLRTRLRTAVLDGDLPADVLTGIYELQQNAEIARSQYQALLQRSKNLETQAYLQVADSRVVSAALAPSRPSFPDPTLIFSLAGIGALGLGIGFAFLAENFVGGFTSEQQLQSVVRAGATASVPRQRDGHDPDDPATVADHVVASPLSMFAEAVRRLRLSLDQALLRSRADGDGERSAVVMLSSATAGEGKTTLALSLARTYAMSGRSTLLIDCDLRKPDVHWQLGFEPSSGLFEYLANTEGAPPLASIMTVDRQSGAQVIVGSRRSDVATDQLLSGPTFARLIQAARENFDVIILDTPPVGPVVDALYLAQHADVIAFVVRWASTSQQDVRTALASLGRATTARTGVVAVLNRQDMSRSGDYSRFVGYYSEV